MLSLVISLHSPNIGDRESYLETLHALTSASEKSAWVYLGDAADLTIPEKDFAGYVATLLRRETNPSPNFVCDTVYWAKVGDDVVGRISIRHELNAFLKRVGGHVGYIVSPKWRGRGIATEMLRLILETDRAKDIGKLLLTCDETNIASEKTILKNGGVLEGYVDMGAGKPRKARFWIETRKR